MEGSVFIVGSQGRFGGSIVTTEVEDAANDAKDGTQLGVSTAVESDDLASDAIFLVSEGEGDKRSRMELSLGGSEQIETTLANEKLDIREAERCSIGGRGGVFARPEEKKESQRNHVGNGQVAVGGSGESHKHDVLNDGYRDGFDSIGRRVVSAVGAELTLETEVNVALGVFAGVDGPQTSERLSNAP
jgi:hypothetical protein